MEFMNEHTIISLDMEYVFSRILPKSPYGMQIKRDFRPYRIGEEDKLEAEYDKTQNIIDVIRLYPKEFKEISCMMENLKEIRQSIRRSTEGAVLDEVEFFQIKDFIFTIRDLADIQHKIKILDNDFCVCRLDEIERLLDPENQGMRTFYIYDSYSDTLVNLRNRKRETQRQFDGERKRIALQIEDMLGVKLKLSGEINILKKDEEKLDKARRCPYLIEGASTLLMTSFKLGSNIELDKLKEELEEIKSNESREEYSIKKNISKVIAEYAGKMNDLFERVGKLDFFMARAEFALSIGGIRPILLANEEIIIKNSRHIKLETVLSKKGRLFQPISFNASKGVTVITGANMGGKTVNLKIAGMLVAMAQYGLFVPAEEFKTCLFDYIYFSIGDMQSIDSGLSTFGSEISGMIEILRYSAYRGLILIDELARGTNPEEGYAISRAIVRYLKTTRTVTLFTTHFDGITREEEVRHLRVRGLRDIDFNKLMDQLNNKVMGIDNVLEYMDYSLEYVDHDYEVPRDALNIARLMGLDERILNIAEEIMNNGKEDYDGKA